MTDQAVNVSVTDRDGQVVLMLTTDSASPLPIVVDPQAAFDLGEQMARAAHTARFGSAPASDHLYLQEQIRSRVTEQLRGFMIRRLELMLNSLREDKTWSNRRLATELLDTVLTKVA